MRIVISRLRTAFATSSLAFFLLGGMTAVAETLSIDRWPTTTYYRYDFTSESGGRSTIRLAAVDRYQLFLNGQRVGTGVDWTALKHHSATLNAGENQLALVVGNDGNGAGTGLMLEVEADNDLFISEVTGLWFWSADEPENDDWLTATDIGAQPSWQQVQNATVDVAEISGFRSLEVEAIAGFPYGVETSLHEEGALQLRFMEGQNLAAGAIAEPLEVTDGEPASGWNLATDGGLNDFARIDLSRRRRINRVRVVTLGSNNEEFKANSLRGYSVQISDDRFRWTEVGAQAGITDFRATEVSFPVVKTRHVRVVATEVIRGLAPRVAEVEVYGTGFAESAVYLSPPLNFDAPNTRKNFGLVTWDAEVPKRTELSLQFRSAGADMAWSDWSHLYKDSGFHPDVPEPATLLQYRVHLSTIDPDRTPVLRTLRLQSDDGSSALRGATGSISPLSVSMGVDTTFVYRLNLDFSGDRDEAGVEKIAIDVPSTAVTAGNITGPNFEALPVDSDTAFDLVHRQFVVTFEPPITSGHRVSSLRIPFSTAQYLPKFDFRAHLFAPGSESPLAAAEDRLLDESTGEVMQSWVVSVSSVLGEVLVRARAMPTVFTPNGDGRNDFTVIELVISKLTESQDAAIHIFDLSGRRLRTLPQTSVTAGTYLNPQDDQGLAMGMPGYWDGRDQNGNVVTPGIYLYRVEIELGDRSVVGMGAVAVAY